MAATLTGSWSTLVHCNPIRVCFYWTALQEYLNTCKSCLICTLILSESVDFSFFLTICSVILHERNSNCWRLYSATQIGREMFGRGYKSPLERLGIILENNYVAMTCHDPILANCRIYIKKNSMVWVRERTIPTERLPLVGEEIAKCCG
jgi:hypothetical protein